MCHALPPNVVKDPHKSKLAAVSPYNCKDREECALWILGRG